VNTVSVPAQTSGGQSLGVFVVTCYDLQGLTASGVPTSMSTVAVDPSVIPLGTTIYIQGVGSRVAQDTGGAIKGNRLDLWEPSYSACMDWGVQSRQVYIEG
jgi:peptidoglycan DL-endopeptidase CwlO